MILRLTDILKVQQHWYKLWLQKIYMSMALWKTMPVLLMTYCVLCLCYNAALQNDLQQMNIYCSLLRQEAISSWCTDSGPCELWAPEI